MEEDSTAFSPPVTRNRSRPFSYPETIKGEVVDDYLGTEVAGSYRWMEDLDSPDVAPWVAAQNTVTFEYLERLPARRRFKQRITELWDDPNASVLTNGLPSSPISGCSWPLR
jgi:prolyl oligopeptidase